MIPLFKVFVPNDIGQKIQEVFDSGVITEGRYSDEFELRLSDRFGTFTSLTNSGTSALTLAYIASGVGPGTDVISTPMTCMATNEPIDTLGARIIWADIDPRTGNIDPSSVAKILTPNTKAIVGVHWSGMPFDVNGVYEVLKKVGRMDVKVIADAAHAMGARYGEAHVGDECDHVCFSFQAIKHLTTVDGGAVTSKNKTDDVRIKKLRWFGLDRKYAGEKWSQDITESGYKFHMNNVNAAIGLAQLPYLYQNLVKHVDNGTFYDREITNPRVKPLQHLRNNSQSSYWIYTVLVDDREKFKKYMNDRFISCDIVHFRNDKYKVFEKYQRNLPGVDEFCAKMINIPVGWWLTDEERQHIVNSVNSYA
jgi:dTDP-4-amino-4,6-dideoxygalactose transaminase